MIIIVLVMTIAVVIGAVVISNQKTVPADDRESTSETELMPEIKNQKEYTGYCAIRGKYRQRYVECIGDYDPEAKIRAEAKAQECNESDEAVHGCSDRYQ